MRSKKKEEFDVNIQGIAAFAKLLSHPARLAIIQTLAARGTCICGELVEMLPLAQATVSQHLKELREGGIVKGSTEGPRSCYCLNYEYIDQQMEILESFRKSLRGGGNSSCC